MDLAKNNEWLWDSRWMQWWFKHDKDHANAMPAPCMDPDFTGALDNEAMRRDVAAFKAAHVNTILTEGLRRTIRFEHKGQTAAVNDTIRRATQACHEAGIKVIHHTTTTFADQKLEAIDPNYHQWLAIDAATGKYSETSWLDGWLFWCINNPEFRAEYFRLCKELMTETGIDGFMVDEVYFRPGWTACVCEHCRAKFHAVTHLELPDNDDATFWGNLDNPTFRTWLTFRMESVGDFYSDLYAALRQVHDHPVLLGCHNADPCPGHDQQYGDSSTERMRGINMLFLESGGCAFLYSTRRLSFEFMVCQAFSNHYCTPTMAITYHPNPNEGFLTWALRSFHGIRTWATSPRGALAPKEQMLEFPDEMQKVSQWFAWEEDHADTLAGAIVPAADVAVLCSDATCDMLEHHGRWDYYVREMAGWCEALTDVHIQYAVLLEAELVPERLDAYRVVALPNAACISTAGRDAIVEYVRAGGCVILTHDAGRFDDSGMAYGTGDTLLERLGGDATAAGEQAGTLGDGSWCYMPDKPGLLSYGTSCTMGQLRRMNTPDVTDMSAAQKPDGTRIVAAVRAMLAEEPLSVEVVQAPADVMVKVFDKRHGGGLVVHVLNLTGQQAVDYGQMILQDYPLEFPALSDDIVIELRRGNAKGACAFSPDWPGMKDAACEAIDRGVRLTVSAAMVQRYTVVHVPNT